MFTLFEIVIFSSSAQLANALRPISVTLFGISISLIFVQYSQEDDKTSQDVAIF